MDKQQDSKAGKNRKSIKEPRSLTKHTEWACWMNGADPEWMSSGQAQRLARVFRHGLPQWLVQSEPWRPVTGQRFKTLRKDVLRLSLAQAAAYLNTTQAEITRWESDVAPVPVAAFEALRLQSVSSFGRLSHRRWDGWFIQRDTGEFVSPDVGRLSVGPVEINRLPMLYAERDTFKQLAEQQAARIGELEAENATLRSGKKVKAVSRELEAMQAQIERLLANIHTADVLQFPVAGELTEKQLRKVAST